MEKYKRQNATKPLPLYAQKSFCFFFFKPVDTLKTSPAVTYRNQSEILAGSVEDLGFFI